MKYIAHFIFWILIPCYVAAENMELEVEPTVWLKDESFLSCSPSKLKRGDVLKVKMSKDHGSELAVYRHSDKSWLTLVSKYPPEEMLIFMTSEQFKNVTEIEITSKTTGHKWDDVNQYIIYKPGKYSLYVSETLESEQGGYECEFEVQAP